MRNLKRALSLALASVMLVGMMVVGTSAASFSDVDSNDNTEAIAVLQALGVMNGYDDGGFHPDANVTRNQMAMIICALLGLDGEDFKDYRPFTDVPDWAAGAVGACYANDIVGGRGEGIYDGDAYVTGVEAAAMMLRALGYTEMPASANWETPIVQKASEIRLFKDVGQGTSGAFMNRNSVAQLALNALKADVVNTKKTGGTVTTPDGTVVDMGNIDYNKIETNDPGYNGALSDTNDYKYQQLCEKLYEDDLTLETVSGGDAFGRPAHKWVYDNNEIITVADSADRTYVGQVTAKDLYSDLGLRAAKSGGGAAANTVDVSNVTVTADGATSAAETQTAAAIAKDDKDTKFGKDGQTVYAYYKKGATTADDDQVTLVIISSYLGVVTNDSAKSGDKTGIRVDVNGASKFFETAGGYAEDDVVLLTMANGEIKEITGTPTTVSGEVTRVASGADKTVTIDGSRYPQAAQFGSADEDVVKGEASMGSSSVGNTYTLYLDANGCYLAAVEDEENTTSNLVYVFGVDDNDFLNTSDNKVEKKAMATVVDMDGTYRDVPVTYYKNTSSPATKVTDAESDAATIDGIFAGNLAYLTYDEDDDEYTLTTADQYSGSDYSVADLPSTAGFELKASDRNTKFGDSTVYYLNGETVYLFVSVDDGKIDKVEIFTGGVDTSVSADTKGSIAFESNKRVGYVVIEDAYTASADDVIYIQKHDSNTEDVKDGLLYKKSFIVGEDYEATEHAVQTGATGVDVIDAAGFYKYTSVKSNGNLDKLTKVDYSANADGKGAVYEQEITSLVDGNGTIATVVDGGSAPVVLDFTKAVIVDISADDANDYGEISSLRALAAAIDKGYTVTVDAYINGDSEVVGLFVKGADEPVAHTCTWEQVTAVTADCDTEGGEAYYHCSDSGCTNGNYNVKKENADGTGNSIVWAKDPDNHDSGKTLEWKAATATDKDDSGTSCTEGNHYQFCDKCGAAVGAGHAADAATANANGCTLSGHN